MAERFKEKNYSKTGTASLEFDDFELQNTMQDFLKEEEKETGKGIWNLSTIAGMAMIFIAVSFILQWIGLSFGQGVDNFLQDAIAGLPLIGGALVTLIGFGFFVGDRRKERKNKRQKRRERKSSSSTKAKKNMDDIHGSEFTKTRSSLRNDLDSDFTSSTSSTNFEDFAMGSYGYRHAKKLMKSRSDKKWAGVCGGLAKYFGISSTVVRFIFVAAFFMGYGASLLIYFGLSLAMPKEPVELMDDFDF
tara:strand:+ start:170 stop:910 length:741 start_codon:yes stop_codon:yes gene_type:complete